jgi:hypothetical protein
MWLRRLRCARIVPAGTAVLYLYLESMPSLDFFNLKSMTHEAATLQCTREELVQTADDAVVLKDLDSSFPHPPTSFSNVYLLTTRW